MAYYPSPKKVRLVYFSGTGGTKMAAEKLASSFSERGVTVQLHELKVSETLDGVDKEDLLVVMYPVYALNAPGPIYDYIKKCEKVEKKPAAVLSVSGGGEVTPNRACRVRTIRLLEKKGYQVVYENMLIMPSNVFVKTPLEVAVRLLGVLPVKISRITDDLLSGKMRRTKPGLLNRVVAVFGEAEKFGAKRLGHHIKVGEACNGCGLCSRNCPMGNITLTAGNPVFGNKCVTCLKCFYNCPQKALAPGYGKFIVLKEGFSLADIEKASDAAAGAAEASDGALKYGKGFGGIKKYLEEND